MAARLAIDGGTPVIAEAIPGGMHGPSRIDQREIDAVTEVLRSGKLFRFVEDSNVANFENEAGGAPRGETRLDGELRDLCNYLCAYRARYRPG